MVIAANDNTTVFARERSYRNVRCGIFRQSPQRVRQLGVRPRATKVASRCDGAAVVGQYALRIFAERIVERSDTCRTTSLITYI
jgi:hypothetical protein